MAGDHVSKRGSYQPRRFQNGGRARDLFVHLHDSPRCTGGIAIWKKCKEIEVTYDSDVEGTRVAGSTHKRAADDTLAGDGGEIHASTFPTSPSSLGIRSIMARAAGNEYGYARIPMKWEVLVPLTARLSQGQYRGPGRRGPPKQGRFQRMGMVRANGHGDGRILTFLISTCECEYYNLEVPHSPAGSSGHDTVPAAFGRPDRCDTRRTRVFTVTPEESTTCGLYRSVSRSRYAERRSRLFV